METTKQEVEARKEAGKEERDSDKATIESLAWRACIQIINNYRRTR